MDYEIIPKSYSKNKNCIILHIFLNNLKKKTYNNMKMKFYYFLLPISRESIVFGSNFRNGDFDGFTRFEVS